MAKTFAEAVFEAEKHSKQEPKFAALSGLQGDELKLVQEALNPYRVFNIKKFDQPKAFASTDPSYDQFFELLNQLTDRTLTGNAARIAVTAVLGQYTVHTAKALQRVLLKDLKCGAGETVFSKLYPTVDFPSFELMLAAKIDEKPEAVRKHDIVLTPAILEKKYGLRFPVIAESKYDGKRLLALVENGKVTYLTRSGKKADWCDGLFDDELVKAEKYIGQPFVLDGEVLGKSFYETARAKGSGNDEAKANLRFYAFDWMLLSTWKLRLKTDPQHRRSDGVLSIIEACDLQKIIKSKSKICYSIAELRAFYAEVLKDGINADGTLNGLGEGLIIKNMHGVYEWDRSNFWFKWKPILDVDLKITGFYAGDPGTKNEDKLGGIKLEGFDENGKFIRTNCGGFKVSGPELKAFIDEKAKAEGLDLNTLNRDQWFRAYVWNHQGEFVNKTAMLEGQELSLAEGETAYAVRFPQFVRIRDDK
jgi:DNA ligase-1